MNIISESGCRCASEDEDCKTKINNRSICYVSNDSTCSDKVLNPKENKYQSWIACNHYKWAMIHTAYLG